MQAEEYRLDDCVRPWPRTHQGLNRYTFKVAGNGVD